MKPTFLSPRFQRLTVPGTLLLVLLQRTPLVRALSQAETVLAASPIGQVLRSAMAAVASVGVMHSLAGATQFVQNPAGTVNATVGTEVQVAFTYTGTPSSPASFTINSGALPPGLSFTPAPQGSVIPSGTPAITGTPTQAGSYSVAVQGWNGPGGTGFTNGISQTIRFEITGGATSTAPAITTQPVSQTVTAGGSASFTVAATGSPSPTYQWRKDGAVLSGETSATLTLPNVQPTHAGAYTVVVSNIAGNVTSNEATLTVTPPAATPPTIAQQPSSHRIASGGTVVLEVVAVGATSYQWRREGVAIAGATGAMLFLENVNAATHAGTYTVVASNTAGSTTSAAATLSIEPVSAADQARLMNLSVRTTSGSGAQTLNVGFAVGGDGTAGEKPLLVRVIGPALAAFGVPGTMVDPTLTMRPLGSTAVTAANDNWSGNATVTSVGNAVQAFPLTNSGSADAAVVASVTGGGYTVLAEGKNDGTGIVLTEIYDATPGAGFAAETPRLVNLSARADVKTGAGVLVAGFVVSGGTSKTLLIRGIGPALAEFGLGGTLADPKLELYRLNGPKLQENDNWGGSVALSAVGSRVGAFGLTNVNSKDSMLLVTLPPGGYTAQISGVADTTGIALIEVYEVP